MTLSKLLFPVLLTLALFAAGCSSEDGEAIETGDDITTPNERETPTIGGDGIESNSTGEESTGDDSIVVGNGGDSESESAEAGPTTTNPTLPSLEPEDSAQQFSQCVRDEGVTDFPDLGLDGNGNIDLDDLPTYLQGDSDIRDAFAVCQPIIEAGGFGDQLREVVASPEFNDSLIDFSDCIRDQGFDVGDLTLLGIAGAALAGAPPAEGNSQAGDADTGFGDGAGIFAKALGLDPSDPKVEAAIETCIPAIEGAMADLGLDG